MSNAPDVRCISRQYTYRQLERQTDRQIDKQIDKYMGMSNALDAGCISSQDYELVLCLDADKKQTDIWIDRQTDRMADRQKQSRQIYRQKE